MTVLANATARLNELQAAEAKLLCDLTWIRSEKDQVASFIKLYRQFDQPVAGEVGLASSSAANSHPVANVGEEANGAVAAASVDPASREADGADRQQPATSGFTGEGEGASAALPTNPETPAQQPGSEAAVADADPAPAGEASGPGASPAPISTAGHIGSWVRSIETVEDLPPAEGAEPRAPSAPKDKRPAAPGTLRAKVEADLAEHPNSTSREIADRIGVEHSKVASIVAQNDLPVRKLTTEERRAAQGRRPLPAPAPRPAPGAGSVVVTKPMARAPKGAQFRLRQGRGEGKWLHMSGTGLTTNRTYAWVGTEAQLLKLRQKFPDASDLVEEVVEKEPVRA